MKENDKRNYVKYDKSQLRLNDEYGLDKKIQINTNKQINIDKNCGVIEKQKSQRMSKIVKTIKNKKKIRKEMYLLFVFYNISVEFSYLSTIQGPPPPKGEPLLQHTADNTTAGTLLLFELFLFKFEKPFLFTEIGSFS